jgi:hypothetical protein
MALTSPTVVRIPKPADSSFADTMSRHRVWLDTHKIQTASFKPIYFGDVVGFEIGFSSAHEAALFNKQFG